MYGHGSHSATNPANCHPNWAELAVLFSRQSLNDSRDVFFGFNIYFIFLKYETIEVHVCTFLSLIVLAIGRMNNEITYSNQYQAIQWSQKRKVDVVQERQPLILHDLQCKYYAPNESYFFENCTKRGLINFSANTFFLTFSELVYIISKMQKLGIYQYLDQNSNILQKEMQLFKNVLMKIILYSRICTIVQFQIVK